MAEEQISLERQDASSDDPRAVRQEIAETRHRISATLSVIEYRLSPRYLRQQAMTTIKRESREAGNRITHAVRENPLPALMAGIGFTWIIGSAMRSGSSRRHRDDRTLGRAEYPSEYPPEYAAQMEQPGMMEQARERGRHAAERAGEKASEWGKDVSERASAWREQASEKVSHVREQASETASRVSERAAQAGKQLQHRTQDTAESAWSAMQEHPLMTGLAIFATGLAAGLLTPTTRTEDRLMGETRDELLDTARERGQELMEKGQHVASRAVEQAGEEARRQGLMPEQIEEEASQTTGEQASEKAKDMAQRAGEVASKATDAAKNEAKRQGFGSQDQSSNPPTGL